MNCAERSWSGFSWLKEKLRNWLSWSGWRGSRHELQNVRRGCCQRRPFRAQRKMAPCGRPDCAADHSLVRERRGRQDPVCRSRRPTQLSDITAVHAHEVVTDRGGDICGRRIRMGRTSSARAIGLGYPLQRRPGASFRFVRSGLGNQSHPRGRHRTRPRDATVRASGTSPRTGINRSRAPRSPSASRSRRCRERLSASGPSAATCARRRRTFIC
jgi:hypothetical protein